jgi:hypothetical protein
MNNTLLKSVIAATAVTISALSFQEIAEAATVKFFDGTFNDSDWTKAFQATGSPSSETAEPSLSGGNPDAFRLTTHTWGNGTQGVVYHFNNRAVYDPSTQGAIASIDYSADVIGLNTFSGVFGDGLLLEQDGRLFISAFTAVRYPSQWQTKSVSGLTSDGFLPLDGDAAPDFSIQGAAITFGYIRTNTISGSTTTIRHGIDNWSVNVTTVSATSVPEPSSILGLLAIGFAAARSAIASLGASSLLQGKQEQK